MKTRIIKYFLLLLCACSFRIALAQQIKLGQQCPDIIISNVINYSDTVLSISDFKGKLIVLDFWNQACLSCIQAFSKMDSLQKKFAGKLQIILVNKEGRDSTLHFFAKHKKIIMPALPLITAANNLWYMFANDAIPYHAWLDSNRILQYVTGPYNLTERHIDAFLKGQRPFMQNSTEEENSTVRTETQLSNRPIYYSAISNCNIKTGRYEFEAKPVNDSFIHMCMPCYSVVDLYKKAYSNWDKYNFNTPGKVLLEMKETYPFVYPRDENLLDEWRRHYSYTYDLIIPVSRKDQRYKFMQQDLEKCFDLDVKIEKRKIKCLALIKKGSLEKLKSKNGKPVNTLVGRKYENDSLRFFKNKSFKTFSDIIRGFIEQDLQIPFINKTGITEDINICLRGNSIDPFNFKELKKDLLKYGLDIIETQEWMDALLIKQKNK